MIRIYVAYVLHKQHTDTLCAKLTSRNNLLQAYFTNVMYRGGVLERLPTFSFQKPNLTQRCIRFATAAQHLRR